MKAPSSFGWNVGDVNHSCLTVLQDLPSCGILKTSKKAAAAALTREHMQCAATWNIFILFYLEL